MNGREGNVDCGVPFVAVKLAGGPKVFVRLKLVSAPFDAAVAVMKYDPGVALAVAVTVARPWALVIALLAESVAPAPEAGAAKMMITPPCGTPELFL